MPEHLLITPFFYDGELRGCIGTIGHVAEIGGMAPGSFSSNATEMYQEGLRLPPVKLVRRGEPVQDVWRIMLANHRTPDHRGATSTLIGAAEGRARRLEALYDEHGAERIEEAIPALFDYSEQWMRRDIAHLPDGHIFRRGLPGGRRSSDRPLLDPRRRDHPTATRSSSTRAAAIEQALGAINAPYVVTASATYNGIFYVIGGRRADQRRRGPTDRHHRAAGTMVNVRHPGACVGGQTELQPRSDRADPGTDLLEPAAPSAAAASGGTSQQLPLRRRPSDDGRVLHPLPLRGNGLGRACRRRTGTTPRSSPRQLPEHADRGARDTLSVGSPESTG